MARVLVAGASGFIGSHLVEALVARGDDVRGLVRPTSSREHLAKLAVQLVEGDVLDRPSLERAVASVDVVYNLAGMTTARSASQQREVNGTGVENMARACAAQDTPPVHVLVSSIAASGPAAVHRLRMESDRPQPVSNYGRSKRLGETAAEKWADQAPTTIVRPGIVFGTRDRLLLPMFKSIARFRLHVVAKLAPPKLSLVHAPDLAQLLIAAAQHGERVTAARSESGSNGSASNGGARRSTNGWTSTPHAMPRGKGYYHACLPEHPDLLQFGRMLARALEVRHVVYLPVIEPFLWAVGGCSELGGRVLGRPAALNIDKIRDATVASWAYSGEKSARQLGFQAAQPLGKQLRETASWYRAQGWL